MLKLLKFWKRENLPEPGQEPRLSGYHRAYHDLFAKMSQLSDALTECLYAARHCGTLAGVVRFTGEGQLPWDWLATPHPSPPPVPRSFVVKRFAGSPNRQYPAGCMDSDCTCLQHFTSRGPSKTPRSPKVGKTCAAPAKPSIEISDTTALPRLSSRKMQSASHTCNPSRCTPLGTVPMHPEWSMATIVRGYGFADEH